MAPGEPARELVPVRAQPGSTVIAACGSSPPGSTSSASPAAGSSTPLAITN